MYFLITIPIQPYKVGSFRVPVNSVYMYPFIPNHPTLHANLKNHNIVHASHVSTSSTTKYQPPV
jgi:hypothetical protein